MRLGLAVAAFAAFVVPSVSYAADRVCASIALLSPAQGQHFIGSRPIHFSWSGEPTGTVTRELHLAALDGTETVIPLDGRFSDTVKVKMTGDLAWAVVFRDADGKVLCTSPAGLIAAGAGGGQLPDGAGGSLSGTVAGAAAAAPKPSVYMNNGRLVIVLQNSPYTGQYTRLIAADSYDGSTEDLQGANGLEIHGNNQPNFIIGSSKPDLIYAYGKNDVVRGGSGQDEIHMGTADNMDISQNADGEVDTIYRQNGLGHNFVAVPEFPAEFAATDNFDVIIQGP